MPGTMYDRFSPTLPGRERTIDSVNPLQAEIKQRFRAFASQQRLTESMRLRRLLAVVLARASRVTLPLSTTGTRGGRGGYGSQIKLRLRPMEIRTIHSLAAPEGYSALAWTALQSRYPQEGVGPFAK